MRLRDVLSAERNDLQALLQVMLPLCSTYGCHHVATRRLSNNSCGCDEHSTFDDTDLAHASLIRDLRVL